jgi:hypothetical protein
MDGTRMKTLKSLFCAVGIIGVLAGAVATAPAAAQSTFTVYTQSVDGPPYSPGSYGPATDAVSSDYGNPGGRFVQESNLFSGSSFTGNAIGSAKFACIELMSPTNIECMSSFLFGANDSISVMGFYTEGNQQPPGCISINTLAVIGGTGKYQGAKGQLKVTHIPVFQPGNNVSQCEHAIHNFRFDFSLAGQNGQNGQ